MPLIQGKGLSRYYASGDVFSKVDFQLEPGQRVGLVGPNGGGKTTLIRIVAGLDEPNTGVLTLGTGLRLGYQAQTPAEAPEGTLWQYLDAVFAPLHAMEKTLDDLSRQMAAPTCPASVVGRFSELQHEFELRGGYTWHNRIETVLTGLGFAPEQHHREMRTFSGGWRTRAGLARLLLDDPDVLLLDEPTNHLDLDAVRWLEQFLLGHRGAMIVVSHDRFFLDKVTTDTWEMDFQRLETYPGNYATYLKLREARYEERRRQYDSQQAFIAETEDFIRRNIAGQRSQEAKGRRKRLERFIEEEAIPEPPHHRKLKATFGPIGRTGDRVLRATDLIAGYHADAPLVSCPELEVLRGDRLAILAPNGAGKTTFMRTLIGEIPPLSGEVQIGANVQIGYFSQTHEGLNLDSTVLDCMRSGWADGTDQRARDLLGGFLFSGDDVFKKVGVLSGGQRSRLALAKLSVSGANLLVMDEPTNHLDIPTQEVLETLLNAFYGTMLLVTHDRYLIRALDTRIAVIADGRLHQLNGGWDAFQAWRSGDEPAPATPAAAPSPAASPTAKDQARPPKSTSADARAAKASPTDYKEQKRQRNERRRLQTRYEELEGMIADMEDEKRMLEHAIGKAGEDQDMDAVHKLSTEHITLEKKLEALLSQWMDLGEQLEAQD